MKSELEKIYRKECVHPAGNGAYTTDKGSDHDYVAAYYSDEFKDKRDTAKKILEIGVMSGGSLILWHHWFNNASIEGIEVWDGVTESYDFIRQGNDFPRIKIHINDAYNPVFARDTFEDGTYDYIIDDGPHSLDSMKDAITLYMCKLKQGGKLVIEDIQNYDWFKELEQHATNLGHSKFRKFDFRKNKNRSDDMIFEITKQ